MEIPYHDLYLMMSAPVSSFTMLENWCTHSEAALEGAVATIVQLNPLLAGKLVSAGDGSSGVACEPNAHSIKLTVVDGPASFVLPGELTEQLTATMELEPLFPILKTGHESLAAGSPLFGVSVAVLPGGLACLRVQLSHLLGDGSAYYQVCAQLHASANGLPVPPMEWVPSPKSAVLAPHFNAEDEFNALRSWAKAFAEKIKANKFPLVAATVLDTAALKQLKAEYTAHAAGAVAYLSTNDVIVAGLNEVTEAPISGMFANMRGRGGHRGAEAFAGNYERQVLYPRDAAKNNPAYVRGKLATDFYHFKTGQVPSLAQCDMACTTSWCQLTQFVEPPGCRVVAHVPLASFVAALAPFELVVCFKADREGTVGLLHNLPLSDPAYQARVAASSIFKRMAPSAIVANQPMVAESMNARIAELEAQVAVLIEQHVGDDERDPISPPTDK